MTSKSHPFFDTKPDERRIKDIHGSHGDTRYFRLTMKTSPNASHYDVFVDLLESTFFTYMIEKPGSGYEKSNEFPFPREYNTIHINGVIRVSVLCS